MPRQILMNLKKTKQKEGILKASKEKQQVTYKGNPIGLTADLSAERSAEKSALSARQKGMAEYI